MALNPVQIVGSDGGHNYAADVDSSGRLKVVGDFNTSDIEIGAVEIKNDSDDTRAKVGSGVAANALRTTLATDVGLPAGTSALGTVGVTPVTPAALTKATVNITTATTTAIVAGTAAQTVRVYKIILNIAATQTLNIISSGGASLVGAAMSFAANGGLILDFDGEPWFVTTTAEGLSFVTTTTGVVTGVVYYVKS